MTEFVTLAPAAELPPGERMVVQIGRLWVAIFNIEGQLYAIQDVCTHDGGPLAEGTVMETCVMCPRHGACFDLKTGHGTFPAAGPIPIYEARIEGDEIKIRL